MTAVTKAGTARTAYPPSRRLVSSNQRGVETLAARVGLCQKVARQGFEPRLPDPESGVLPLHHQARIPTHANCCCQPHQAGNCWPSWRLYHVYPPQTNRDVHIFPVHSPRSLVSDTPTPSKVPEFESHQPTAKSHQPSAIDTHPSRDT